MEEEYVRQDFRKGCGDGLEATISLDRNADLSRLRYKGVNLNYFSPCGYAVPIHSLSGKMNSHFQIRLKIRETGKSRLSCSII